MLSSGQKIGRYQVVRLIGKGGMGEVYEAVDQEIERRAAIKVLHAQYSENAEMAARFLNEARAVNIIQHPSLVAAFELGKLDDGTAYIVMEYLDGETLRQRLERGRIAPNDAMRIARQICSALCAAHAKHIVHRDLKPSNIMMIADPDMVGGERVKVLDFGIAKLTESKSKVSTRTGALLGSPGYMSPEQCRNVSTVDERSDVYSLGIMLFEMLAGKPPFFAQSDAEVMAMHLYTAPPNLAEVDPSIDAEISQFVQRMLCKQTSERPKSAEVLSFLNAHAGFPAGASMPHAIVKAATPVLTGVASDVSTLSRATGQGQSNPVARRGGRRLYWVGAGLVALLAIGLIVRLLVSPPVEKKPAPAANIRWNISSTPPDAEVLRQSDKQSLGRTPFVTEQPRGDGSEALLLRHAGYEDVTVTMDRSASRELSLKLTPLPAAPAAPPPAATVEKTPSRGKGVSSGKEKRRKSGKVTNAEIPFIK